MSADVLREAASQMRARATGGIHYRDAKTGQPLAWVNGTDGLVWDLGATPIAKAIDHDTAAHIVSWHPSVAFTVANLLEEHADGWDAGTYTVSSDDFALAVARAYLGEAS